LALEPRVAESLVGDLSDVQSSKSNHTTLGHVAGLHGRVHG
jgi:hypothetical protein